jgi:hypothetical protein
VIELEEKMVFVVEMNRKSQLHLLIPSRSCAVMQHSAGDLMHEDRATWPSIHTL